MIYKLDDIILHYESEIGFEQRSDPKYKHISSELVNDFTFTGVNSEILKTENLLSTIANDVSYIRIEWDVAENYTAGDYIDYQGNEYFCLVDNVGLAPDINPTEWELIGAVIDANAKLANYRVQAIRKAFSDLDTSRGLRQRPTALQSNVLYQGNGGLKNTDGSWNYADKKGFHGAMLKPQKLNHSIKITKVGLQLSEAVAGLPIYLYNSGNNEFISTTTVDYTTPNSMQWLTVDFTVKGFSLDASPNSEWYIGYFASDLGTAEIIQNDWANTSYGWCQNCAHGRASANIQRKTCNYYYAEALSFDVGDLDGLSLPARYPNFSANMPINLELTIFQDPTRTFINQSDMFKYLVRLAGAVLMLEAMGASQNLNRVANLSKDTILRELHGYKGEGIKGIIHEYKAKLEEVANAMNNLDEFKTARVVLKQRF